MIKILLSKNIYNNFFFHGSWSCVVNVDRCYFFYLYH